eukprot:m.40932 g.40932  ORF g.40932 m.40932 type:complete len:73 (-) comp8142_c0_seq2:1-219(-)
MTSSLEAAPSPAVATDAAGSVAVFPVGALPPPLSGSDILPATPALRVPPGSQRPDRNSKSLALWQRLVNTES